MKTYKKTHPDNHPILSIVTAKKGSNRKSFADITEQGFNIIGTKKTVLSINDAKKMAKNLKKLSSWENSNYYVESYRMW